VANRAQPALTWQAPTEITYGTALGTAQLNALATVAGEQGVIPLPGEYLYSPPAGAVLPAGSQTLAVTFQPSTPPSTAL